MATLHSIDAEQNLAYHQSSYLPRPTLCDMVALSLVVVMPTRIRIISACGIRWQHTRTRPGDSKPSTSLVGIGNSVVPTYIQNNVHRQCFRETRRRRYSNMQSDKCN